MARTLLMDHDHVTATVKRHAGFWEHGSPGGFLRCTGIYAQSSPVALPQPDARELTAASQLEPGMVSPDDLIRAVEEHEVSDLDARLSLRGEYLVNVGQGDLLPLAMPLMKFPWLEAILGCRIEMTDGQIWDKEYPGGPEAIASDTSSFDHNPWFELYLEFLRMMQDRLTDRFFVSPSSNQRGVSDLVAAVMGVREALVGWIDRPQFMARMLRRCTDAVLALVQASNGIVQSAESGFVCKWGLWAPGKVVATQADHASLLSPEIYTAQILPYDREVFRSSPMSIIHLHNNGLHHAAALMDIPELDAIQVWVDPFPTGDRKAYEVGVLQEIARRKPLIVDVYQSDPEESDRLLEQLPADSLFYKLWLDPDVYDRLPDEYPGTALWLRG